MLLLCNMGHDAWNIFKIYAPHNPQLDNFKDFFNLVYKLETRQPFHIARYNDGEWIFILQIKPHYLRCLHHGKHSHAEVRPISDHLLQVMKNKPHYLIGIDSSTQAHKGPISSATQQFQELLPPNLVYGEIFNAATVMMGFEVLSRPLKQRYTLTVGPDYMQLLKLGKHHITVPEKNCWTSAESVRQKLQGLVNIILEEQPVIVYSCSILAKWLVDIMYQTYGNSITQLDIGSCIDPWCGLATRPWHTALIKQFNIQIKPPPVVLPQAQASQFETCLPISVDRSPAPLSRVDPLIINFSAAIMRCHTAFKKQKEVKKQRQDDAKKQAAKKQEEQKHAKEVLVAQTHNINIPKKNQPAERLIVLPASISTGKPAPRSSFK